MSRSRQTPAAIDDVTVDWSRDSDGHVEIHVGVSSNAVSSSHIRDCLVEVQLWRGRQLRDRQWIRVGCVTSGKTAAQRFRVHQRHRPSELTVPLRVVVRVRGQKIAESIEPERLPNADAQGRFVGPPEAPNRPMGDQTRLWVDDEFRRLVDEDMGKSNV
ncbi:MAG: hypothetical protein AAF745_07580 [Planctomycetota bacterium]